MNERSETLKNQEVITFISGKGGVGKTALVAAVGKVLALLGSKVLLIDSDLVTHGLTFLVGFDPGRPGLLEIYLNFKAQLSPLKEQMEMAARRYKETLRTVEGITREADRARVVDRATLIHRLGFMRDKYEEATRRYENAAEHWRKVLPSGKEEDKTVCRLAEGLHLLQSTSAPSRKHSQLIVENEPSISSFLTEYIQDILKSGEYHFILIDAQAGWGPVTKAVVALSTKVVTVMEPDPVSTYATENVAGELSDVLPRDSFRLVNKLSVEEASAYRAIESFLKILNHLPPIPFDFEVRRAFMTRRIPVDENKPTPFMFGVLRMLKDLLPDMADSLEEYERALENKALAPTKERMTEIEHQLDSLVSQRVALTKQLEELKEGKPMWTELLRTLSVTALVVATVGTLTYQLVAPQNWFANLGMLGMGVAAMFLACSFVYETLTRRKTERRRQEMAELEKNLAVLRETENRMRSEHESYMNLLITRSKELLLITEGQKESPES